MKPNDAAVVRWVLEQDTPSEREPGWLTALEIAQMTGNRNLPALRLRLERAADVGRLQRKKIRTADKAGTIRTISVFYVEGGTDGKAENAGADGQDRRGNHRRTRNG